MTHSQEDLTARVLARLEQEPAPFPSEGLPEEAPAAALAAILARARATVAALNAELAGGTVEDLNHYDYLVQNLPRLAGFESFSLAEYTYHLADGRNPGVRLWLEEKSWRRRVKVLLFPEVGRWQVDAQGRKITRLLLTLELEGEAPRPVPAADIEGYFHSQEGWATALSRALCLATLLKA
ncbi:MAG: hypothetical protein KQI62_18580 [Deltaproteobacteria bacterium]|nr:hypothetical protein [Deltaproteobacteria bacterium]